MGLHSFFSGIGNFFAELDNRFCTIRKEYILSKNNIPNVIFLTTDVLFKRKMCYERCNYFPKPRGAKQNSEASICSFCLLPWCKYAQPHGCFQAPQGQSLNAGLGRVQCVRALLEYSCHTDTNRPQLTSRAQTVKVKGGKMMRKY